jgi:hypothetical protein
LRLARTPFNSNAYGAFYDFGEWSNYHNDVTFSLRFIDPLAKNADANGEGGSGNDVKRFLIESETTDRTPYGNRKIAPLQGGWIKLGNDVPVLSRSSYSDAITQAEVFNVEPGTGVATQNESVAVAPSTVRVVSGVDEVTVLNAGGRRLTVTNLLGQKLTDAVLESDRVAVKAPKGIVIVSVEGEKSVKSIVK